MALKKKVVLNEISDMETLLEKFKVKNGSAAATGNFQKHLQKPHLSEDSGVIATNGSSKIAAPGKSSTMNNSIPEFVIRTTSTSGAETSTDNDKRTSILDGRSDIFSDHHSEMQNRYASATASSIAQNNPSVRSDEFVQNLMMAQSSATNEATAERRKLINCLDSMTEMFMEFKQSNDHTSCQVKINGLRGEVEDLQKDYQGTYYFIRRFILLLFQSRRSTYPLMFTNSFTASLLLPTYENID